MHYSLDARKSHSYWLFLFQIFTPLLLYLPSHFYPISAAVNKKSDVFFFLRLILIFLRVISETVASFLRFWEVFYYIDLWPCHSNFSTEGIGLWMPYTPLIAPFYLSKHSVKETWGLLPFFFAKQLIMLIKLGEKSVSNLPPAQCAYQSICVKTDW